MKSLLLALAFGFFAIASVVGCAPKVDTKGGTAVPQTQGPQTAPAPPVPPAPPKT